MKIILLNLTIILSIVGCTKKTNQDFGFEFNTEREKLGIPVIEDHWTASFPVDSFVIWHSNSFDIDTIGKHVKKWIKVDGKERIFEEDSFYKRLEDSSIQQILIRYSFNNVDTPWSYQNVLRTRKKVVFYGIEDVIAEDVKMTISKEQTISKLKEWNIKFIAK
jgi:hypothetical protein